MPLDQYIPLPEAEAEAAKLRDMLKRGEGSTDMLYGAYQAMLLVLGYGVMPPSHLFGKD